MKKLQQSWRTSTDYVTTTVSQWKTWQKILVIVIALFFLFIIGLFIGYSQSSDEPFFHILNPVKWRHIFQFIFV
ncbi:DNA-directed RNA polymerase subunit beta [Aerococcus suis]|uniref:DNA-directed RNA polymerase subunit beta n=1 Tax=Aerococcus suis TaxID=371602 RepID=A0A1W1YDT1_9LACT|nr:DNA-directed RNA polymerase subunit beta [Aerococcus suis]MCI7240232.1 DNA-directed RNA polymerase subunit beta [Aerococcus suis]MDD7758735.1 DNA-directed RNA polymerase subunit beta [Aerococcus suis]MDY4646896.1 DNA-directed RNA polymerase subunit beta [Aerococcus suis]SMC34305.1 DNA-directed RNA polymerase subunit beta [Aerococcus suis]